MNDEENDDELVEAETTGETEQPQAAPVHPDPQAQHTPTSPVGINPRLWFNRRPRNRKR